MMSVNPSQSREFVDVKISPSELSDVQFFRYRKRGVGKLVEYIQVRLPDNRLVMLFDNVSKSQFISKLGGKVSEIRSIYDYNERNAMLSELAKARDEPIIMRLVKGSGSDWHCYAVVTEQFTEVKHVELYQIVENRLKELGYEITSRTEMRTSLRVWRTYMLNSNLDNIPGDIINIGIRVANSVKGTSSIIIYPCWVRLACSNGMTSSEGFWKQASVHKGNKSLILDSVVENLDEALSASFGIMNYVKLSRKIMLSRPEQIALINEISSRWGFPAYIRQSFISRSTREPSNLWGLVNALTYVSSHDDVPVNSKLTIEQAAHSLLVGGKPGIDKLLNSLSSPLSRGAL